MTSNLAPSMLAFAVLLSVIGVSADFNIPIPFGNIALNKGPNGTSKFGINSGLNIGGHGAESGMTFTTNNGSFNAQSGGGILVGGNKFGTNSTLDVDKQQGLTADTDLHVGKNQTLHGGLGKENTFINDLAELIRRKQEERRQKQQKAKMG